MAARDTLLSLAERVEKAEGPDRSLDKRIFAAVYPDKVPTPIVQQGYGWREDHGSWWLATGEDSRIAPDMVIPRPFTASIDAALTLLPSDEGVGWRMSDGAGGPTAEVWRFDYETAQELYHVGANPSATPALALCAAALRAHAALNTDNGGPDGS